jgi:hypothetical protein
MLYDINAWCRAFLRRWSLISSFFVEEKPVPSVTKPLQRPKEVKKNKSRRKAISWSCHRCCTRYSKLKRACNTEAKLLA